MEFSVKRCLSPMYESPVAEFGKKEDAIMFLEAKIKNSPGEQIGEPHIKDNGDIMYSMRNPDLEYPIYYYSITKTD